MSKSYVLLTATEYDDLVSDLSRVLGRHYRTDWVLSSVAAIRRHTTPETATAVSVRGVIEACVVLLARVQFARERGVHPGVAVDALKTLIRVLVSAYRDDGDRPMSTGCTDDPRHPHERTTETQPEAPVYDKDGRCLVRCRDELFRLESELERLRRNLAAVTAERDSAITASKDGRYVLLTPEQAKTLESHVCEALWPKIVTADVTDALSLIHQFALEETATAGALVDVIASCVHLVSRLERTRAYNVGSDSVDHAKHRLLIIRARAQHALSMASCPSCAHHICEDER